MRYIGHLGRMDHEYDNTLSDNAEAIPMRKPKSVKLNLKLIRAILRKYRKEETCSPQFKRS